MGTNNFLGTDFKCLCQILHFSPSVFHMKIILGYHSQSQVILILSYGLERNGQDHMTNSTRFGARISDPGSPAELDEINVHFVWSVVLLTVRKRNYLTIKLRTLACCEQKISLRQEVCQAELR